MAVALPGATASAQVPSYDTLAPLRPMYGVGLREFYIGAWSFAHPANSVSWSGAGVDGSAPGIDSLWKYAGEMGFNILRPQLHGHVGWIDELAESHRFDIPGRDFRFYIHPAQYTSDNFYATGFGREVRFFPFDSAQSPYFPAILTRHAGESRYNPAESGAQERWFTPATARPGDTVAGGVLFNRGSCEPENRHDFLSEYTLGGRIAGTVTLELEGRLVGDGVAMPDTAPILSVGLWHLVDRGEQYLVPGPGGAVRVRARRDTAILCDTMLVRRGELAPAAVDADSSGAASAGADSSGRYRRIWRAMSLVTRGDGGPGPFHPAQLPPDGGDPAAGGSLDFDIRVVWLGPEGVAVRSVAIRDTLAELILGATPTSDGFRERLRASTLRLLHGPDTLTGPVRRRIIGVMSGIEQHRMNYAGFAGITDFLRRSFNWNGDSLAAHTEDAASFHFHHLTRPDGVFPEIGIGIESGVQGALELPYELPPQIARHNGDRFREPYARRRPSLLRLETPAIERFEEMMQRGSFTRYDPEVNCYPYHTGTAHRLGVAARVSRRTGRRMIPVIFCMGGGLERQVNERGEVETFIARIPEGSELRAVAMMALCYGAHGVLWTQLGSDMNLLQPSAEHPGLWLGGTDSWGAGGPRLGDTLVDLADTLRLTGTRDTIVRAAIPNVWVGHRSRTREIREINRWLAALGPELTRLRWRDSYSIHFASRFPGLRRDVASRPIADTEIVASITARKLTAPRPETIVADPPARTYVELGLFEKLPGVRGGAPDPLRDTTHLFLVNRRTFERPIDVDPASAEGRRMDTLAESRRITVTLRPLFPEASNFLHVREVAPDPSPLPLFGARLVLDTVIVDGGSFSIDLRPGGGALVELTRVPLELFGEAFTRVSGYREPRVMPVAGGHDARRLAGVASAERLDPLRELRDLSMRRRSADRRAGVVWMVP